MGVAAGVRAAAARGGDAVEHRLGLPGHQPRGAEAGDGLRAAAVDDVSAARGDGGGGLGDVGQCGRLVGDRVIDAVRAAVGAGERDDLVGAGMAIGEDARGRQLQVVAEDQTLELCAGRRHHGLDRAVVGLVLGGDRPD